MPLSLLCVGKLHEPYWEEASLQYEQRLRRFTPIKIGEVPGEPDPLQRDEASRKKVLQKEGERLLKLIKPDDYVIAMCIDGRQISSEEFAELLTRLFSAGKNPCFIIGGSMGLDEPVIRRANEKISMGKMTFPHRMARIMLLEQLYRAAKINAGERYHK